MKWCALLRVAGVALVCAMPAGVASAGPAVAGADPAGEQHRELSVHVEDGRVSAAFVDTPLTEAMAALAREAGFELVVEGALDRRLNMARHDMNITTLLGELLQGCSWFSLFGGNDAEGRARLTQVWILSSPACAGEAVAGVENAAGAGDAGGRTLAWAPRALASFSTIDKDDLARRQHYLGRVINGQARASVDELVEAVRDPRDPSIRILSLMALGRTGGPEARAALLEALSDPNGTVRRIAARSLAQGWGEEAVAPLGSLLATETEMPVIHAAVQQLGMIGTDAAREVLRRAVASDDPRVSGIAQKTMAFVEKRQEGAAGQP